MRKGELLLASGRFADAQASFEEVLRLERSCAPARTALAKCKEGLSRGKLLRDEQVRDAMNDPEIRAIWGEPRMHQILKDMSEDPDAAEKSVSPSADGGTVCVCVCVCVCV